MTYLKNTLLIFSCFIWITISSQNQNLDVIADNNDSNTAADVLPKISKDSTQIEISEHVKAMIKWMTTEYYKS